MPFMLAHLRTTGRCEGTNSAMKNAFSESAGAVRLDIMLGKREALNSGQMSAWIDAAR